MNTIKKNESPISYGRGYGVTSVTLELNITQVRFLADEAGKLPEEFEKLKKFLRIFNEFKSNPENLWDAFENISKE